MTGVAAYTLLCVVFPFLMAYAAASDLLTLRISNRVTSLIVLGFGVYALLSGMAFQELALHGAAGLLTLVISFVMFARGWMGGGDAKLAAGAALWLGIENLADYLLVTLIIGGALTLAIVYARSYPLPRITLRLPFAVQLHDARTGIPYGIALAAAALIVLPNSVGWDQLVWM